MKKEYIKPTMEIINIETQYMLAASGVSFHDDNSKGEILWFEEVEAEKDVPAW